MRIVTTAFRYHTHYYFLQKFLKEASTPSNTPVDQHQTQQEESESGVAAGGQEERNYKPRVPTVQGQYDSSDPEHLGGEPWSKQNSAQPGEATPSQRKLSSEDLQAVREGLARAKQSLASEGRKTRQPNQSDMRQGQSMRVVEEEPVMPRDYAAGTPQPQYLARRERSLQYDVTRPSALHHNPGRHVQPQDSTRQPQNLQDLSNHGVPVENGRSHLHHPQPQEDAIKQTESLTGDSQKQYMPEEVRHTRFRSPHSVNEDQGQPQLQRDTDGQPHSSHDFQPEHASEEVNQRHFRQVQSHYEAPTQPEAQDANEQPHTTPEDIQTQHSPEDDRQRQQQVLDQLYIQHLNLERNNYHRERQIVEKEINQREMMRNREKEQMWLEQRRQAPNRSPQEHHRPLQHQEMTPGSGLEQRESGRSQQEEAVHREEFIPYDERHPAWRDQRLPRGVNPKKYYIRNEF